MVMGKQINYARDDSGKIIISVWTVTDPATSSQSADHHDFTVEIGPEWVCIGGGAKGRGGPFAGNFLTKSAPTLGADGMPDFMGWSVATRDHVVLTPTNVVGYAIGMKIMGLTRDQLISNLIKVFPVTDDHIDPHIPTQFNNKDPEHPQAICVVKDGLLLGGGFEVIIPSPDIGGNMATASYPNSTFSWKVGSKSEYMPTPTKIKAYAIGIKPTISLPDPTPADPNHRKDWNVVTSFASANNMYLTDNPFSNAIPLDGYALCGGGADVHYTVNDLIWALEPTTKEIPLPPDGSTPPPPPLLPGDQGFSAHADAHMWHVSEWNPDTGHFNHCGGGNNLTAYAMGIKLVESTTVSPPNPDPGVQCNNPINIIEANSLVTLNPAAFPVSNVYDGPTNTKWMSKVTQNPSIHLSLEFQKRVCKIDIAWGEGNLRRYKFNIELSKDNQNWVPVITGGQSAGNVTTFESYSINPTVARYVSITVTDSGLGTGLAQAQIGEVKVFSDQ